MLVVLRFRFAFESNFHPFLCDHALHAFPQWLGLHFDSTTAVTASSIGLLHRRPLLSAALASLSRKCLNHSFRHMVHYLLSVSNPFCLVHGPLPTVHLQSFLSGTWSTTCSPSPISLGQVHGPLPAVHLQSFLSSTRSNTCCPSPIHSVYYVVHHLLSIFSPFRLVHGPPPAVHLQSPSVLYIDHKQ